MSAQRPHQADPQQRHRYACPMAVRTAHAWRTVAVLLALGLIAAAPAAAGGGVVLGGVVYGAPHGEGWGSERPETIFNGGDPSGLISEVHWSSWGGPVARGH